MRRAIPEGYEPRKSADHESRGEKARLIGQLIGGEDQLRGRKILEIGCGNGVITAALAEMAGSDGQVWGVDVVDRLMTTDGFDFVRVTGTEVPFDSDTIDVVVSNHVIEHVGSASDQLAHLRETSRVLARDGFCYLATPNRWWIREPHFSLPFLSWLPPAAQNAYVRITRRAENYDCRLVSRRELVRMVERADLRAEDLTSEAIEMSLSRIPLANRLPKWTVGWLARVSPTFVLKLRIS